LIFRAAVLVSALVAITLGGSLVYGRNGGGPAPDAVFTTLQGERIALRELRGKAVLVTFWASDCASCLKEIPHLIELHQDYAGRGLRIIGVAMAYDMPSRVVDLTAKRQLPYAVVFDLAGRHARDFGGVDAVPASFLISPEGGTIFRGLGPIDLAIVRTHLDRMLTGI
jgi:thiol-disulfide isomerase/thioredoxin